MSEENKGSSFKFFIQNKASIMEIENHVLSNRSISFQKNSYLS